MTMHRVLVQQILFVPDTTGGLHDSVYRFLSFRTFYDLVFGQRGTGTVRGEVGRGWRGIFMSLEGSVKVEPPLFLLHLCSVSEFFPRVRTYPMSLLTVSYFLAGHGGS